MTTPVPLRRVLVGIAASLVWLAVMFTTHQPGADTPATSPDILTPDRGGR